MIDKMVVNDINEYINNYYIRDDETNLVEYCESGILLKCCSCDVSEIEDVIANVDDSFSTSLLKLIDETNLKDPEVYKRAMIDRKLFSKIRSNQNYRPSKSTAIALAIALKLDLDDVNNLISKAGYTLSHSNKRDLIIEYFIKKRIFNLYEINEALVLFNEATLP